MSRRSAALSPDLLNFLVAYKENLTKVQNSLLEVATRNPLVLEEPKSFVLMQGFEESGISIQFSVWGKSENSMKIKNRVLEDVKKVFRDNQIDISIRPVILHQASSA